MVVSELRGEKIDIIPWNTEPARFIAKALSPARVREVLVDDETKEATVIVPEDQLALAIGKEGLNARLAARLTGWKVDIQSDAEFAQAEAEAAFAGGADGEEFSGRCVAILANGKRCPNASIPGSRFCGIAAHRELAEREAAGEELEATQVVGGVSDEAEEVPVEVEAAGEEPVDDAEAQEEVAPSLRSSPKRLRSTSRGGCVSPSGSRSRLRGPDVEEPQEAPVEPEVPIAVEERRFRAGGPAKRRVSSSPTRTCAGCGRKAPKGELIRFVAQEGVLTPGAQAPGRGVYTCRRLQCFERAAANRGFARTLQDARQGRSGSRPSLHY